MITKSFEELLKPCRVAVERYCKFKLPTAADAEDVLSEVYLTAYCKFSQLGKEESFKPWILSIARRKCADFYRLRAARAEVPLDDISEDILTAVGAGSGIAESVRAVLERLSSIDREVLILFYFDELPQADIARKLGIPLGTVKSRLHTAKERFRANYSYRHREAKGEYIMNRLPEIMPEYRIEKLPLEPFAVKWEETMGWMIIPRVGEKLSWGLYDAPSGKRTEWTEMEAVGKAEVHGIEGVEIVAVQHDASDYYRTGSIAECEWRFIDQLTDTHCRTLAESHVDEDGVRRCHTFLDGDEFMKNWGFGPENCGKEINIAAKGLMHREGNVVTGEPMPEVLDIVGRYKVTINGREYDTVCIMDIEAFNDSVATEQFVDRNGHTVLWRRFNRDDWAFERYGKKWTEILPENERLTVNGETYVHWYDCITDYIL